MQEYGKPAAKILAAGHAYSLKLPATPQDTERAHRALRHADYVSAIHNAAMV